MQRIYLCLAAAALLFTGSSLAESKTAATDSSAAYQYHQYKNWMARINFSYLAQQSQKPSTSVESTQPLYMSRPSSWFWTARAGYQDDGSTLNLGTGYRYLSGSNQWMPGLNVFYANNIRFHHAQLGLGGEIFNPYTTLRLNYYDGLSDTKRVSSNTFRKALNGGELNLETPFPYMPWIRLMVGGYYWQGDQQKNTRGGVLLARTFPFSFLETDIGIAADNREHGQGFIKFDLYMGRPAFIEYNANCQFLSSNAFTKQSLEDMRLQKPIRAYDIRTELHRA